MPTKSPSGKASRGWSGKAAAYADSHYLVVDGIDGRSHYVGIGDGVAEDGAPLQGIVRIAPRPVAVRQADRTIAEVAARHGGIYSIDNHLKADPTATESYAETHVRRLEAMRKISNNVERRPSGAWIIAPDHLARVEAHERTLSQRTPVVIETLSHAPFETLPGHDGATWLDRELVSPEPVRLEGGFGTEVRSALVRRQQWLIEQGFAEAGSNSITFRANMLAALRQRELNRVAGQLSEELGLAFKPAQRGETIEGTLRCHVRVGDSKFAVIEKSREFTLVPWRPVLERHVGKQVAGIMREGGISWTIGRSRGLGIG